MDVKEALEKALEFEREGYQIYKEVSESSFNPLVKKTFAYLAEQELLHVDEIQKYMEAHGVEFVKFGDNLNEVKEFFSMTMQEYKEGIEFAESDVDAYEKALDLEKSGYDYYKSQRDAAEDDELRKFFTFVMEQERAHYLMLEKTLNYIKTPEEFHLDEEEWSFEG